MKIRYLIFSVVTAATLIACGESKFKSGVGKRSVSKKGADAAPSPPDPKDATPGSEDPKPLPVYNFSLLVNNGKMVTGADNVGAEPYVLNGVNKKLGAVDLGEWQVKIHPETEAAKNPTPIESQFVDLAENSGLTRIIADFSNKNNAATGQASQIIYVDGEAPKANLIRLSDTVDGLRSRIVWSITDNYGLDEQKSAILGCKEQVAGFQPSTRAQIDNLPSGCVLIHNGVKLHGLQAELSESSITIDGKSYLPRDVQYAIYAEDQVGLSAFSWINKGEGGLLTLKAAPTALTYTNKKSVDVSLGLLHVKYQESVTIDALANSGLWPNYELNFSGMPAANAPSKQDFKPSIPLVLGAADGTYLVSIEAIEKVTSVKSNQQVVRYVLDTTPPVVNGIQIAIDKIVPSTSSKISLKWTASDANPIVSQVLEIKGASDSNWTKVKDLSASDRSATFDWGSRKVENFEVRIAAKDIADNTGYGTSKWVRQIFNAAILTKSVQCYFCHMTIKGDVGGIDFGVAEGESGLNFEIIGRLYATNTAPQKIAEKVKGGAANVFNNYKNTDLKIFPKDNKFPVLSESDLKARVTGTLSNGSKAINKVYVGNLILDGSKDPIVLNGEVFVDGELVIKGKYQGVGTIYAKNIYVADDIVATKSPFPFSDTESEALVQAQASVARGDDGLYLGALNSIVIGTIDNLLNEANGSRVVGVSPFKDGDGLPAWNTSDLNLDAYIGLGTRPTATDKNDGSIQTWQNHHAVDHAVYKNEVNRVDAYLYAAKVVSWRSYANVLLNGGFMSPEGGFVAVEPYYMYAKFKSGADFRSNPRNGLNPIRNEIRYDWRLRIGAGGFETLKTYFDQQ